MTVAARVLGEPAHKLIYLCEQGVVVPDIQESEGRGTSRLFSTRNLFEFAIALRLRDATISVGVVGAVIRLLGSFERAVRHRVPGFALPSSLREADSPDFRLIISDGTQLYCSLGMPGHPPSVFGPVDLRSVAAGRRSRSVIRVVKGSAEAGAKRTDCAAFGGAEGSQFSRFELSVTRIAQALDWSDDGG